MPGTYVGFDLISLTVFAAKKSIFYLVIHYIPLL